MSTDYLRQKLSRATTDNGEPILTIHTDDGDLRVYSPDSDEYRVNADVVEKARDLGADIIAYAESWCGVTIEGGEHGKNVGIEIMPFADFFGMLRRRGVPVN